jgi:alpha-mannosidase
VRDASGNTTVGQIIERGDYWGHRFAVVAVPAKAIPATGYTVLCVETGGGGEAGGAYARELGRPIYGLSYVQAQMISPVAIGNEFVEATICPRSGGIVSLVDKETGAEFVPPGKVLGAIEREQEAPHGMTAWQLAPIVDSVTVLENCVLEVLHKGPNVSTVRLSDKHNESTYRLTISLASGSRELGFTLDVNWLERGDPATGVPVLRATFPLALTASEATFEIACGSIERDTDGEEVPALNWANLSGAILECANHACDAHALGAALLNDSKYGYQATEDALRLTLLRSSFDPDPLPEMGAHQIRFALLPYAGEFAVSDITRAGYAFNHPLIPVGTTLHEGELAPEASGLEILTPNVMLSGVKKAEDADAAIIRLYEMTGQTTRAQVRLSEMFALPNAAAFEVDLLEQPLARNTATMEGDVLSVEVPAFGIASVQVMHPFVGYNAI